jgi:hypothetical protein
MAIYDKSIVDHSTGLTVAGTASAFTEFPFNPKSSATSLGTNFHCKHNLIFEMKKDHHNTFLESGISSPYFAHQQIVRLS